jgi:FkbM family methyltransferase
MNFAVSQIKRALYVIGRFCWLKKLMGGAGRALKYIWQAHQDDTIQENVAFKSLSFRFRVCDENALKEVLHDREYAFLTDLLQEIESPTILDIGSHIGLFAIWAFTINPKAKILSVEASKSTFDLACMNAKRNPGFDWSIINRAAWRNADHISFSDAGSSMGHHVSQDGACSVAGIDFVSLVQKMGKPVIDVAKIDIEGAEEAFFENSASVLPRINNLVIELHPDRCDTTRVLARLKENYKRVEEISGRKSAKPLLFCRN